MPEYAVVTGGRTHLVGVTGDGPALQVSLEGHLVPVRLEPVVGSTQFRVTAGELRQSAMIRRSGADIIVTLDDEQYRVRVELAVPIARKTPTSPSGAGEVKAPIPGLVVSVEVAEGDIVEQGRPVAVMEAMKMQSEMRAPVAGTVTSVRIRPGQEVMGGTVLVTIMPAGGQGEGTGNRATGKHNMPDGLS